MISNYLFNTCLPMLIKSIPSQHAHLHSPVTSRSYSNSLVTWPSHVKLSLSQLHLDIAGPLSSVCVYSSLVYIIKLMFRATHIWGYSHITSMNFFIDCSHQLELNTDQKCMAAHSYFQFELLHEDGLSNSSSR